MGETSKIQIYKASAGSGKTHRLTQSFAEYLFEDYKKDREAYKHIMAVTFTNAATGEMKERVLAALDKISRDESDERQMVAQALLNDIVHDYSMFKVSTIDSFFQTVLRAFAFELGKRSAYDISLDDASAVASAVDNMYAKLGSDKKLLALLTDISLQNIEDEKSWDFRNEILKFCSQIVKEKYLSHKRKFPEAEDGENIQEHLKRFARQKKQFEGEVERLYNDMRQRFAASELTADAFKGKSRSKVFKFLTDSLAGKDRFYDYEKKAVLNQHAGELFEALRNRENWTGSGGKSADFLYEDILDGVNRLEEVFTSQYKYYVTIRQIEKNIKETALLQYAEKELANYCASEHISLLLEAPDLLNRLIGGSDAPFIYEKIGTRINHFLLDEFQDTSVMQWENFKPLLKESLSKGYSNMLVGDVKQSIYRWRGGDWNIFDKDVFREFKCDMERLVTNYRSLPQIIDFNNAVFSVNNADGAEDRAEGAVSSAEFSLIEQSAAWLAEASGAQLRQIYADAVQKVSPQKAANAHNGYVEIVYHEHQRNSVISYNDFINKDLLDKIHYLTSRDGYAFSDIAILVDKNSDAAAIADFLMENGVNVVSKNSLLIDSSLSVYVLLNVLRKIADAEDCGLQVLDMLYGIKLRNIDKLDDIASGDLTQICERVLSDVMPENLLADTVYIQAFMDKVLEFSLEKGTSLTEFVKWWDANADRFAIPASATSANAVQLMTIHKSKGLAFKVVLVPYMRNNIGLALRADKEKLWCMTSDPALGLTSPVLIDYGAEMQKTLFSEEFKEELFNGAVDAINMAYVAFTRAVERLYVYATVKANESRESSLSCMLGRFAENAGESMQEHSVTLENAEEEGFKEQQIAGENAYVYKRYAFGQEWKTESAIAGLPYENVLSIERYSNHQNINISLRNRDFGDEEDIRHRGIILHKLYSYLDGPGDLDSRIKAAAQRLVRENPSYVVIGESAEEIAGLLRKQIGSVAQYNWFSDDYVALNEREILWGKNVYRPDRIVVGRQAKAGAAGTDKAQAVVIDYKFGKFDSTGAGGAAVSKYRNQVLRYKSLLKKMGYADVKGYLWYVIEGEVIEVE